jgi:hypothetical protein
MAAIERADGRPIGQRPRGVLSEEVLNALRFGAMPGPPLSSVKPGMTAEEWFEGVAEANAPLYAEIEEMEAKLRAVALLLARQGVAPVIDDRIDNQLRHSTAAYTLRSMLHRRPCRRPAPRLLPSPSRRPSCVRGPRARGAGRPGRRRAASRASPGGDDSHLDSDPDPPGERRALRPARGAPS